MLSPPITRFLETTSATRTNYCFNKIKILSAGSLYEKRTLKTFSKQSSARISTFKLLYIIYSNPISIQTPPSIEFCFTIG